MAKNAIFIIICIVSIIFCSFFIHKLNQQESSLLQLKSSLEIIQSTYTSILEKSIFDINEQDIAMLENINFQLAQIADFLEKHKNQAYYETCWLGGEVSSAGWFWCLFGWIPALKNELLAFMSSLKSYLDFLTSKISEVSRVSINTLVTIFHKFQSSAIPFMKELIQALKIQLLNFISNLKPHIDFLTTKISEVSLMSINSLVTIVENFQRSATPFIKESYNSAIQMSTSLLFGIVKWLNDFFHFCLEAARQYWTR
ncbi:transmembrane protein, putative [Medicago truncatula]|uniref:Transmembrane protein, putative n=1 Tax=Medicago truncatula TaxID=3880 RepID=G7IN39_MEDTR|nr:transmembrane protein, putative [Medicago truncatula]